MKVTKLGISATMLALFLSFHSNAQNDRPERGRGERPEPAELIERMDANGDGQLSSDEVKGPIANDFSSVDANSDGLISVEEITQFAK